jgi:hydroxymethylpyrimidine pyrophosphatase-like HAD family hydrolase
MFASDLDNTLIHSYRAAKPGDVCVETKDGRELSFMSPAARGILRDVAAKCTFVPVTTRSAEQYRRIDLGVKPKYALAANGALLLVDGEADMLWAEAARRRLGAMPDMPPEVERSAMLYDVRCVDGFFICAKSENPRQAVWRLEALLKGRAFEVRSIHDKVYVLPSGLDKGTAVQRLMERISPSTPGSPNPPKYVICAGDSELDLPMLDTADAAIVPDTLELRRKNMYVLPSETYTSAVPGTVREMLSRARIGKSSNSLIF